MTLNENSRNKLIEISSINNKDNVDTKVNSEYQKIENIDNQ